MNPRYLLRLCLAALVACLLLSPARATAGLVYDLRVNGGKAALVTTVGEVITLDLFAQVTGAAGDSRAEGFQEGFGSILSSAGGNISGSLSSSFVAPFDGIGAQPGMQQTLDADSDLDLGSNSTVHSTEFFFARATSMQSSGTPILDGMEFKIASFSFTVQSIGDSSNFTPISINFRVPLFSNNFDIEALWMQDSFAMSSNGLNGGVQPTVGAPVMVSVPEPSTIWLAVTAVAALAARRRRVIRG